MNEADMAAAGAALGGTVLFILATSFVISLLMIISGWKIYTKAGKPGWGSIIPIYNAVLFLEICKRPVWWIILLMIPVVNIIPSLILLFDFPKQFGKGAGYALGLMFLPFIFHPMLAFGDAEYQG